MRILLQGQSFLRPLLEIHELMELIIDYLDFPSITCLSMSNKTHFGMNSDHSLSLLTSKPSLWVNLMVRYDCVLELTCRYPSLSILEDVEAMNDGERLDFSWKCQQVLSECFQSSMKKYKLEKIDMNQLCGVCGELVRKGEVTVQLLTPKTKLENSTILKKGKIEIYEVYIHWDCLGLEEMTRRNIKRLEIAPNLPNGIRKQAEQLIKKVEECRGMRKQQLFGVVCDGCSKFQSSRYYSGLDNDSNRVDLCVACFSNNNTERKKLLSVEKLKPTLLTCKKCSDPIKNAVFTCQYCNYYSLCEKCFENIPKSNSHSSHPFTLVGCRDCASQLEKSEQVIQSTHEEKKKHSNIEKYKKRKLEDEPNESKKKVSLLEMAKSMGFEDLT